MKNKISHLPSRVSPISICYIPITFPDNLAGKESVCNVGELGSIPGLGRSPGEGKGYPLQYSGLENSMDCIVHGVAELETTEQLSLSLSYSYNTYIAKININTPK